VQAEKTSSENPAIEISPQLTLNEPGNGCALLTCVGEKTLESVAHHLVEGRKFGDSGTLGQRHR
jgi:hypothetical protein